MSVVNITNIQVLDNPTRLTNPFQFEITFECIAALKHDLEWKIVYVGSAEDETYDQVLDCIMVGPVPVGINKFVFQADAPSLDKIPLTDLIGVTVVLITCSYQDAEFVRVGYYVNNEYEDEVLRLEPPEVPQPGLIRRTILADKPRVTRFPIRWDDILDETVKRAEDEALDQDADAKDEPPEEEPEEDDAMEEGDDDEVESPNGPVSESCNDDEGEPVDDSDEFTSQLGPEEQDRMSMMIDEDDMHHHDRSPLAMETENLGGDLNHLEQSFGFGAKAAIQHPMEMDHHMTM